MIKFKTPIGFTVPYPAIIDTGAHTSVIPLRIWSKSEHKILGRHHITGLIPDVKLDVKVGEIKATLVDPSAISKEYKFLCFFSPNDKTPLILGFKELLSEFKLVINYPENLVWIEEQ